MYYTNFKWKVKVKAAQLYLTLWNPMDYTQFMEFSRPEYWSGWPFPSPGDLPNLQINPRLPNSRWFLYQLSHKGNPRILEWVACHFSSESSKPRNQTGVSCIAGRFFTNWAIRESQLQIGYLKWKIIYKTKDMYKYRGKQISEVILRTIVIKWTFQTFP